MKSTITRAILLVAPVIDALQEQLAADFPLLRLYEQEDPIAFLREQGENIAAVVTRGDIGVQNSVLELLPHVGLIAIFGVGTDAVDLEYVRSRQIQVSITSGVLTNDVADLAMGLLLAGSRNLCQGDRFVREGRWLNGGLPLATQVSGKRIGLLGMGNIGQAIARRASGFDMEVLYTAGQSDTLNVEITTSVDNSQARWNALFERLSLINGLPGGQLIIHDFGATPGVARIRIEQVFEEVAHA